MSETHIVSYYLRRFIRKQVTIRRSSFQLFNKLKLIKIVITGNRLRRKNEIKYNTNIPPVCILSVTRHCNLSCKGCYVNNYVSNDELNLADIEKIIGEAVDLGIYLFVIAGGEPLMVQNIIKILSKYPKAIFLIFTNGLLINDHTIQTIKKNRHIIPVLSFEGNELYNEYRRGEGKGFIIEQSLKKLQNSKIIYGFSTMAISQNIRYITSKSYFNKMKTLGASFGFIIDYTPKGNKVDNSMILSVDDMIFKNHELDKRRKDSDLVFFNLPDDENISDNCWAGKTLIHINASGDIEPCMFYHYSKDNIKHCSLIDSLKSDFIKKVRKQVNGSVTGNKLCSLHDNEKQILMNRKIQTY